MIMGHVTIRTKKFDEEIKFYEDVVGFNIVADMRKRGSDIVFLAEKEECTKIEIIRQDNASDSGNEKIVSSGNENISKEFEFISIGFEVSDAEKYREELIAKGIEAGPMISPVPPVKFFFVKDPAGVNIQFVTQKK